MPRCAFAALWRCRFLRPNNSTSPHKRHYETYRTLKEQSEWAVRAEAPPPPLAGRQATAGLAASAAAAPAPKARKPGKLSFAEQRELEGMEPRILAAEARKAALEASLADPATYQKAGASVAGMRAELEDVAAEVERLYARWQELEALRQPG